MWQNYSIESILNSSTPNLGSGTAHSSILHGSQIELPKITFPMTAASANGKKPITNNYKDPLLQKKLPGKILPSDNKVTSKIIKNTTPPIQPPTTRSITTSNENNKKTDTKSLIDENNEHIIEFTRKNESVDIKNPKRKKWTKRANIVTNNDNSKCSNTSLGTTTHNRNGKTIVLPPNPMPAWIFCTRYSDRPSSGSRVKRKKKTLTSTQTPKTLKISNHKMNDLLPVTCCESQHIPIVSPVDALMSFTSMLTESIKVPGHNNTLLCGDGMVAIDNMKSEKNKESVDMSDNDKRPRTAFTHSQLQRLKREFLLNPYLTEARRRDLSRELQLNENQIKIWFQNKRAKLKKKKKCVTQGQLSNNQESPLLATKNNLSCQVSSTTCSTCSDDQEIDSEPESNNLKGLNVENLEEFNIKQTIDCNNHINSDTSSPAISFLSPNINNGSTLGVGHPKNENVTINSNKLHFNMNPDVKIPIKSTNNSTVKLFATEYLPTTNAMIKSVNSITEHVNVINNPTSYLYNFYYNFLPSIFSHYPNFNIPNNNNFEAFLKSFNVLRHSLLLKHHHNMSQTMHHPYNIQMITNCLNNNFNQNYEHNPNIASLSNSISN